MSVTVSLTPGEEQIVRAILLRHLPPGTRVFVFGSRAGHSPKPMSDLDLSLEGANPLPLANLARLAEEFDESPLRWKVDLVDRASVSDAFGKIIDATKLPFELGGSTDAAETSLAKS